MVIPTGFGGKLGGDRPVVSWIFQETTWRRDCETGVGGMDDDPTIVSRRVPARRKEDRDIYLLKSQQSTRHRSLSILTLRSENLHNIHQSFEPFPGIIQQFHIIFVHLRRPDVFIRFVY